MQLRFFDTNTLEYIESLKENGSYYQLAADKDYKLIGFCFDENCQTPVLHLDDKGVLIQRYTELKDSEGNVIFEGDSVELAEHDRFSDSIKKSVWTVKMRNGQWVMGMLNVIHALSYVNHKIKVLPYEKVIKFPENVQSEYPDIQN